ncbi:hypothetical protein N7457_004381 [Penicillium paradoxum]|nr:uncharacterized protein N7457_004381 [Penicillium paradoxum]KAJ5782607.1 hypothetical protein N7457_004381 [Penicillium paradoxum]
MRAVFPGLGSLFYCLLFPFILAAGIQVWTTAC